MISMSKVNSIREKWRCGQSVSDIAKTVGVSRTTVYKYAAKDDFSAQPKPKQTRSSKLDPYKPAIDQWLDDDRKENPKQRHTAKRIFDRLVEEYAMTDISRTTVERYVGKAKAALKTTEDAFLDLVWSPAEAQADFGEASFYIKGVRCKLKFFVLVFPFSNVGFVQVLPGENAECVCQGLRNIFDYIGGVPGRIVFDNAAGVGRKLSEGVRTTLVFEQCAAHYGFSYTFCNPYAGHEKGGVENKVGTQRRNLLVPIPHIWDMANYNTRLLNRCMDMAQKDHYLKGEPERQLFQEDVFALSCLPDKPFACVSINYAKADKKGRIRIGGQHWYSTDPTFAGQEMIVALGAFKVTIYSNEAGFVCEHDRAYGSAPTSTTNPASQLAVLAHRPGGWINSQVRAELPDQLRDHFDLLNKPDLSAGLRLMRDQSALSGWDVTVSAMESVFAACGHIDEPSVSLAAARQVSGTIAYDEPVDLAVYDALMGGAR